MHHHENQGGAGGREQRPRAERQPVPQTQVLPKAAGRPLSLELQGGRTPGFLVLRHPTPEARRIGAVVLTG